MYRHISSWTALGLSVFLILSGPQRICCRFFWKRSQCRTYPSLLFYLYPKTSIFVFLWDGSFEFRTMTRLLFFFLAVVIETEISKTVSDNDGQDHVAVHGHHYYHHHHVKEGVEEEVNKRNHSLLHNELFWSQSRIFFLRGVRVLELVIVVADLWVPLVREKYFFYFFPDNWKGNGEEA